MYDESHCCEELAAGQCLCVPKHRVEEFQYLMIRYFLCTVRRSVWTYCIDIRHSYVWVPAAKPGPSLANADFEVVIVCIIIGFVRVTMSIGKVFKKGSVQVVFFIAESRGM